MVNRRLARVATSDDEDDGVAPSPPEEQRSRRKRKTMKIYDDEDEEYEEMVEEEEEREKKKKKTMKKSREEEKEEEASPSTGGDGEEEAVAEDAKPIGEVVRVSGKGRNRRNHYKSFEYDGITYELEDPVLLVPEVTNQKPYVAIIKDITEMKDGSMMVTGQWFYRPEEAERKNGGNWQSSDSRELFYSFHRDEVPAESVMHKCVVHFIPLHKQIPHRKQHPGFIVQKVYDTDLKRLFKLTDKDYEDNKQHEIDLLVQKTMSRIGDLPDIETEDAAAEHEEQSRNKRLMRRKNMSLLDVSRDDELTTRSGQPARAETPGSCANTASEYYKILANFSSLTSEVHRDKWLEKLLQAMQFICVNVDGNHTDSKENGGANGVNPATSKSPSLSETKNQSINPSFLWPDAVVPAVTALEKASHESFSSDFQKYNQKMRQLSFNLKNNAILAQRLLKGELEPAKILNMSPTELKEGLTAEEIATNEPEESARMQMTDAMCKRCTEKKVGLVDIIQAGHGDRYQLECIACGNTWYASRDEASTLTIDGASSAKSVGTAPWATAKFEDVEKKLLSPRESASNDLLKKATEPYLPVLDNQKSFNKSRTDDKDNPSAANATE